MMHSANAQRLDIFYKALDVVQTVLKTVTNEP